MRCVCFIVICATGLLFTSLQAQACSCLRDPLSEEFEEAALVFSGTVTAISDPIQIEEWPPWYVVDVDLDASAFWKGEASQTITIRTPYTENACGYPFKVGKAYLVFAFRVPDPTWPLTTSYCSLMTRLEEAEEILDQIGDGYPVSISTPIAPTRVALFQNYPNPAVEATAIRYELAHPAQVRLDVYDVLGRRVSETHIGWKQAGAHEASIQTPFPSGVYFYRLAAGTATVTGRMMVLK